VPNGTSTAAYREFLAAIAPKKPVPVSEGRQKQDGGSHQHLSTLSPVPVVAVPENIKVKIWAASLVQMWDECKTLLLALLYFERASAQ
jgi:hypothetical protein